MIDQKIAKSYQGLLRKKSNKLFLGYQNRFWRVQQDGTQLVCYHKDPQNQQNNHRKAYDILDVEVQEGDQQNKLILKTPNKYLILKAENEDQKNRWIKVITLLKKNNNQSSKKVKKTPVLIKRHSVENGLQNNVPLNNIKRRTTNKVRILNAQSIKDIILQNDINLLNQLNLQSYIKKLPEQFIKYHILSGVHKIKKNDTFSIYKEKFFLLFSSKSLYPEKHISQMILLNTQLPPWLEINCLYQIDFRKNKKINLFHTKNIIQVEESALQETSSSHYTIKINTGQKIFEVAFNIYAMRNKWKVLLQRANKNSLQIEKNGVQIRRNIDLLIHELEQQTLSNRLYKLYQQIKPKSHTCEQMFNFLYKIQKEFDQVIQAALLKKYNSIITFYFDFFHQKIFIEIKLCWDSHSQKISTLQLLRLAKLIDSYNNKYRTYISDLRFVLGLKTLVRIIARKNWITLKGLIISIVDTEKQDNWYEQDGLIYTNSIIDLFKFLQDSFNLNFNQCNIKKLSKIFIQVFKKCFWLYMQSLKQIIDQCSLSNFQLVGIINNSIEFMRLIKQFMDGNFIKNGIQQYEVIQSLESQQLKKQFVNLAQICRDKILNEVVQKLIKCYNNKKYINCNLYKNLQILNQISNTIQKLDDITRKKIWKQILDYFVKEIMKSIILSTQKKKQTHQVTVSKLQNQILTLKQRFQSIILKTHFKSAIGKLQKMLIVLTSVQIQTIIDTLYSDQLKGMFDQKNIKKIIQYRADLNSNQFKLLTNQINKSIQRKLKQNDFRVSRRRKKTVSLKVPGVESQDQGDFENEQQQENYLQRLQQQEQQENENKNQNLKTISEGFMLKKQKNKKFWQKRYFRLKKGVLYWYPNKNSSTSQNFIKLNNIISYEVKNPEKLSFNIKYKNQNNIIKDYKFKCQSINERQMWLYSIKIQQKNNQVYSEKPSIKPINIQQKTTLFVDYDQLNQVQGYDLFKQQPKFTHKLMKKDSMKGLLKKQQLSLQNNKNLNHPLLNKVQGLQKLQEDLNQSNQQENHIFSCLWKCFK